MEGPQIPLLWRLSVDFCWETKKNYLCRCSLIHLGRVFKRHTASHKADDREGGKTRVEICKAQETTLIVERVLFSIQAGIEGRAVDSRNNTRMQFPGQM